MYNQTKVLEAIEEFNKFTWTVKHKNEHFTKANELIKLYDFIYDHTNNCILFEADSDPYIKDYFKASYDFKHHTNKELNKFLNDCRQYLKWELKSLYNDIIMGDLPTEEE